MVIMFETKTVRLLAVRLDPLRREIYIRNDRILNNIFLLENRASYLFVS